MSMFKTRGSLFLALAALLFATRAGMARPVAMASFLPFDKVEAKVEKWIQAHPKDASGYRSLARIHALAWGYGALIPIVGDNPETLPVFAEGSTVQVTRAGSGEMVFNGGKWIAEVRPERPVTAEDAKHLAASIAAYRKAIELDPNDALSELGLGWMLAQQGAYASELPADDWEDARPTDAEKAAWAAAVKQLGDDDPLRRAAGSKALLAAMPRCARTLLAVKTDDPEVAARIGAVLRDHSELAALEHDRKAFDLKAQADLAGQPTYDTDSQISARAGAQIESLLKTHPEVAKPGEVKAVQAELMPLAEKKRTLDMMPQ